MQVLTRGREWCEYDQIYPNIRKGPSKGGPCSNLEFAGILHHCRHTHSESLLAPGPSQFLDMVLMFLKKCVFVLAMDFLSVLVPQSQFSLEPVNQELGFFILVVLPVDQLCRRANFTHFFFLPQWLEQRKYHMNNNIAIAKVTLSVSLWYLSSFIDNRKYPWINAVNKK